MKRVLSVLLLLALLLCGCAPSGQLLKEPVTFYYILKEYEYGGSTSVIDAEEREASGHRDDLSYLMALYLMGPTVENLRSPIPRGTRIYAVKEGPGGIELRLSDTASLSEAEFTRACACLTMTLLGLTEAKQVTITSGSRTVTMTRDNLVFLDNIPVTAMEDSK